MSKIIELDENNTCKLCDDALAKYSCPKCNIIYCSVACYQSEKHLQCSEDFYKECILDELSMQNNDESKKKMLEILKQNHSTEVNNGNSGDEVIDSDDEADIDHITERLAGVDLDNADQVWLKLTEDEKQEFIAFLKSEDVTKLIPSWKPWWSHLSKQVELVEELEKFKKMCPEHVEIKDFNLISKKTPAQCVKFNLINILAAYAFTARYFNGEYYDFPKEVVSCIISISLQLKNNQNFDDYETAIKSIENQCTISDWIVADLENYTILKDDVANILKGPSEHETKFYILSALSDLKKIFTMALSSNTGHRPTNVDGFSKTFPNDHFPTVKIESKTQIKNALRKFDYYLSYSKDYY